MTRTHIVWIAAALVGAAIALRFLLALGAPAPFGYVYDFYHQPILLMHEEGKLPKPDDCWQCYQPPLFTLVGYAIFSGGMAATGGDIDTSIQLVAWFTVLVSLAYLGVVFLIVRHYVKDDRHLAALSAFLVTLPVVFLASYSIESDLFCATLMLGAFYLYLRYAGTNAAAAAAGEADVDKAAEGKWDHWGIVLAMALLAGLSALTKYSGLVIIAVLALLLGINLLSGRAHIRRRFSHLALFCAVAAVVGAYPYVTNIRERGKLITGNRAWQNLPKDDRGNPFDWYEFDTFHIGRLIDLMEPDAKPGELKRFAVYNKAVFSSHYGQVYTDCSVFSNPTRHGLKKGLYPEKKIPILLVTALLGAGLIPVLLGLVGLIPALARPRENLPLLALSAVFIALYVPWFLRYPHWMLKTKYLFVLVPVGLVLCGRGLALARRAHPRLEHFLLAWMWMVAGLGAAYGIFFAVT